MKDAWHIDADDLVQRAVALAMERIGDTRVYRSFTSVDDAAPILHDYACDVIVVDPWGGGGDGPAACARLAARAPNIPIVVHAWPRSPELVGGTLVAGAQAYVHKSVGAFALAAAVEASLSSDHCVVAGLNSRRAARTAAATAAVLALTARQVDVLRAVANGMTSRETAEHLGISPRTVESHRASLMVRLGVSNRSELVSLAIDAGLRS